MTIGLTGGGTGGHIYPALAVLEHLRAIAAPPRTIYLGARGGREESLAQAYGLTFIGLSARKIQRLMSPDTLWTLAVLFRGYLQARRALQRIQPDAILGTGGYVAAAACLAAAHLQIPVILHEQNAVPGRTNLWLARKARRICVSFRGTEAAFPAGKAIWTGVPIRSDIVSTSAKAEARTHFGIPCGAFVILVLGGSQGSAAINATVRKAVSQLPEDAYVLHQTGDGDNPESPSTDSRYLPRGYFDRTDLPLAYRSADLVVSRAGASSLAEIAANELPSILVPYPYAYADHQTVNAGAFVEAGAAALIPQSDLSADRLISEFHRSMSDRSGLVAMARAAAGLAARGAAEAVADEVMKAAGR